MTSTILLVEDDRSLRDALAQTIELAGYHCQQADSAEAAIAMLSQLTPAMILSDIQLPGRSGYDLFEFVRQNKNIPMVLMTAFAELDKAVEAVQQGAVDYLTKPIDVERLESVLAKVVSVNIPLEKNMPVVADHNSQHILALAKKVAVTDSSVLISGESGTGKEVLAQYIHNQSPRCDQAFIAINCAAIPENMLEATLFGHEKGAFTGAITAQPGKFELANGGTILLDEISEMDLSLQAKLLRVLQEREVERIGARKSIKLDVRVIATTNRDLMDYVRQGKFREDLFYRLNVFPLAWKALRERVDDILPLANHLLQKHCAQQNKQGISFSQDAQQTLCQYEWPGNVRELDNAIQRALILQSGNEINQFDLGLQGEHLIDFESQRQKPSVTVEASENNNELKPDLTRHEFDLIVEAISLSGGRKKQAAERLGISPRTLRYKLAKMREMGLNIEDKLHFA